MKLRLPIMKITLLTGKTFNLEEKIVSELGFPIKVIKSSRAKRLTLRIDSKNHIPVVSIPNRCSASRAIEFIESHRLWIEQSLKKLPISKNFEDGETISLFGEIVTIKHNPKLRRGVYLEDGFLYVSGELDFLHRRVKDFIKKEAQKIFYNKSKILADKLDCKLNDVTIKDTKSRWGSCSSMHNINYSWRIALAPQEVIDYLIAHEVAHLFHQDHSRNFWNCVKSLEPQSAKGKLWLKLHGKELYLYE